MQLFRRELREGVKAFSFWSLGILILCFAGIAKYEGFAASEGMMELLDAFPRVVLAVLGMVDLNLTTLTGYTALLFYFARVCALIYAIHLGGAAVSRELVDKTYEFVFTRPVSRGRVLGMKIAAAYVFYTAFCVVSAVFSILAVQALGSSEAVTGEIWVCALSVFLSGSVFLALSACIAAFATKPEKGAVLSNLAFFYAFFMGMVYNLLENPGLLRLISPMNYFLSSELAGSELNLFYTGLTLVFGGVLLALAFARFRKKDLL